MTDVWIAGAGMTRFGRRDENLPDLMAEAALAALADAGIERPERLVVAAMNPEEFTGEGNYASADRHAARPLAGAGAPGGDRHLLRRGRASTPPSPRSRPAFIARCWWWAARR